MRCFGSCPGTSGKERFARCCSCSTSGTGENCAGTLAEGIRSGWNKSNEFGRVLHDRIIRKKGQLNLSIKKVPNKYKRFIKDLGYTLLAIKWRWIILTIFLVNAFAYFLFTGLWALLSWTNGDLSANIGKNHSFCINGSRTFMGFLLLSVETLTTIGFGTSYPLHSCGGHVWVVMMLETLANVTINGALVTAVYVKVTRPLTKDSTRLFSKRAVICQRDGKLCFIFRVCDKVGKHRVATRIKAYYIEKSYNDNGELVPGYFVPLKLNHYFLLIWPLEIVHEITQESPLWKVSADDLTTDRFEIFVVIEGDSILTGQRSKSQSSYVSDEILWGHRFDPCIGEDDDHGRYYINYKQFNKTTPFPTPRVTAKQLYENQQESHSFGFSMDLEKF